MNEFLLFAVTIIYFAISLYDVFSYQVLAVHHLPLYLLSTRQTSNASGDHPASIR